MFDNLVDIRLKLECQISLTCGISCRITWLWLECLRGEWLISVRQTTIFKPLKVGKYNNFMSIVYILHVSLYVLLSLASPLSVCPRIILNSTKSEGDSSAHKCCVGHFVRVARGMFLQRRKTPQNSIQTTFRFKLDRWWRLCSKLISTPLSLL